MADGRVVVVLEEERSQSYSLFWSHATERKVTYRKARVLRISSGGNGKTKLEQLEVSDTLAWSELCGQGCLLDPWGKYRLLDNSGMDHRFGALIDVTSQAVLLMPRFGDFCIFTRGLGSSSWDFNIGKVVGALFPDTDQRQSDLRSASMFLDEEGGYVYLVPPADGVAAPSDVTHVARVVRVGRNQDITLLSHPLRGAEEIVAIRDNDEPSVLVLERSYTGGRQLAVMRLGHPGVLGSVTLDDEELHAMLFMPRESSIVSYRVRERNLVQTTFNYRKKTRQVLMFDLDSLERGRTVYAQ